MTISKKILIVTSLLLNLQFNVSAHYCSYKIAELKAEITSIFNFMDTLKQENTETAKLLTIMLEKEFKNVEEKYNWTRYDLEDIDIINMARIIAKNIKIGDKIVEISEVLTLKETAKQLIIKNESDRLHKEFMQAILAIGTATTIASIFIICCDYYSTLNK